MIERANGIVLRTRSLTETSLIVQWLTAEFGRITTVAKGARRAKSPFRGKLDLFYEAEFSFQRSRRSELHALREVVLRETHPPLRREIALLNQAAYCSALVQQATEKETPLPSVFAMFHDLLAALPQNPPSPRTIFAFELKLLGELGLQPDLDKTRLTPGARSIAKAFTESEWESLSRIRPSGAQIDELRRFLHGFLIYHLERIPQSRAGAIDPEA